MEERFNALGIRVLNPALQTLLPHIPSAKTNRSNELTFDLVAQLHVSVHMTSLLSCL